jgi:hypothetical protein
MAEQYANGASTTLNGAINNSVTTVVVASATGFPSSAPYRILVKAEGSNTNEIMTVTAGAGTTSWTVTRASEAYGGSSAASAHANAAVVRHVLTKASLLASPGPMTTKGDLISANSTGDATRLPVGGNSALLRAASGTTTGLEWQGNNFGASAAPTVNDDSGDGYSIGSRWLDTTNDKEYVALDVTAGAAVWVETTATGGTSVSNERTVDDTVIATWVDRTDEQTDEGIEWEAAQVVVVNDVGPNGENVIETLTNSSSANLLAFELPPGSWVRVDLYEKPIQGGGSQVYITTGGTTVLISTLTAAAWTRHVRIVQVGSDGLFKLGVAWQHHLANLHFTLLHNWHLFDSWVDRADTNTENGLALTNVTRTAGGAPNGNDKLTTASGGGPNTHITYSNMPVGADVTFDLIRDAVAGGSTFFQATVQSGTFNIGNDTLAGQWRRNRRTVRIGTDGSLVLKSTFTNDLADLYIYLDAAPETATIQFVIDGGGSVITTGVKGYIEIPFACQILGVRMLADVSGSIVVDIWKDTYANYPPVDADSITASAVPTISSATKSEDVTLTGWTKSIVAGDILGFNVDSATTVTRVTVSLTVRRVG